MKQRALSVLTRGLGDISPRNLVGQPISIKDVPGELNLKLWVANSNGKAVIMRRDHDNKDSRFSELDLPESVRNDAGMMTAIRNLVAVLEKEAQDLINLTKKPTNGEKTQDLGALFGDEKLQFETALQEFTNKLISVQATCFYGDACFASGTPIRTLDGFRTIEALRVGDMVLSRDENDPLGEVSAKMVEEVFVRNAAIWELGLGGEEVRTTGEHPFYVAGKGWLAVHEMSVGDQVLCLDGSSVGAGAGPFLV